MSISVDKVENIFDIIEENQSIEEIGKTIFPKTKDKIPFVETIPWEEPYSEAGQDKRLKYLKNIRKTNMDYISGEKKFDEHEQLKGNIENFIGMAQIPVGIAGPLLINGTQANGDFFIPMATTEGALVASYNRGMKACREAGGISAVCLTEGVQRSPFFKFKNIVEVGFFAQWLVTKLDTFKEICSKSSRFAKLRELRTNAEGNSLIITLEYSTGDASGQNMVTISTNLICEYILKNSPVKPQDWLIESNYSGDKKATAISFSNVRGKKVTAEVVLSRNIIENVLKTTPEGMVGCWRVSTLGAIQSGAIGAQGHVANGLTALFIACGQDVACISESAVGITRMELTKNNELYVSLTLPSLIVGTVGGGTALPTQKECLNILDCYGVGKARKFAEICTSVALAGEISIAAAISAGHFVDAHKKLGR